MRQIRSNDGRFPSVNTAVCPLCSSTFPLTAPAGHDAGTVAADGSVLCSQSCADQHERSIFAGDTGGESVAGTIEHVDVDDTSRCPRGTACEVCGSTTDLRVWTAGAKGLGVYCLTLCEPCELVPRPPSPPLAIMNRVCEHCGHLGITLDDMAALL